jgi:hypothetical protein
MYDAHVQNKKIRQQQKAMMTHMSIPVFNGSEDLIAPPGEWKSKHKWTSSEDSIPEAHDPWSGSPPNQSTSARGDDENEVEDDGEEDENKDEDEGEDEKDDEE